MTADVQPAPETLAATLDPARPLALLSACPVYQATPFGPRMVAGREVLVKDETARMRLGAFKALGGVYAVAALIAERWQAETGEALSPQDYQRADVAAFAGGLTFLCASAGNHGMAVAAGARLFGARAKILLSEIVPQAFAERLVAKGATVGRAGQVYDESIAAAIEEAAATGAIHLADGSWPGYTHAPRLVMEGYTVMAEEMRTTLEGTGRWPSHVFLQAGVGGLAAAVAVMIRRNWAVQPEIIVVEPEAAPCLAASHAAGACVRVEGPVSAMGRLDCKVPSALAFDALEGADVRYLTVTEEEAAEAVTALAEAGIATSPSGAAGLAGLSKTTLPPDARALLIVSEGPA
ncbi:MAG: pyridoxal-phosphate dependent enzyme [Pseudomonadota bacterium]